MILLPCMWGRAADPRAGWASWSSTQRRYQTATRLCRPPTCFRNDGNTQNKDLEMWLTLVHCRPEAASQPLPWPWGQSRWTWCQPWWCLRWCHAMNAEFAKIVANQPISAQVCESQQKLFPALPVNRAGPGLRVCLMSGLWSRQAGVMCHVATASSIRGENIKVTKDKRYHKRENIY